MPYEIVYDIDYSALKDIVRYIETRLQSTSALVESIQAAGDYATQQWINTAAQKFTHSQGVYARGIMQGVQYPFRGDPLYFRIENKVKYAKALENGFSSFDMKRDRKSTRLNSSHIPLSRMPSSA